MVGSKHPPEHPRFDAQAEGLTEANGERGEAGRLPIRPEGGVRLEDSSIEWRAFQAVIENPENAKELTTLLYASWFRQIRIYSPHTRTQKDESSVCG